MIFHSFWRLGTCQWPSWMVLAQGLVGCSEAFTQGCSHLKVWQGWNICFQGGPLTGCYRRSQLHAWYILGEGDRKQANRSAFYDPRSDILSLLFYFGHTILVLCGRGLLKSMNSRRWGLLGAIMEADYDSETASCVVWFIRSRDICFSFSLWY